MEFELGICWAREQRPNQLGYVPDVEDIVVSYNLYYARGNFLFLYFSST
jgi:hypothetical protein